MARRNIAKQLATIESLEGDSLRISPKAGTTVAKLRDALRSRGIAASIDWASKSVFARKADASTVFSALANFSPDIDADALKIGSAVVQSEESHLKSRAILILLQKTGAAAKELRNFDRISQLDPHQIQATAIASHPEVPNLCLFDEQGLGKTVTALFSYHRLRQSGLVSHALILCPKNMVMEWERDCLRFFPGGYQCKPIIGTIKDKRSQLATDADLYVSNFETAIGLQLQLKKLMITKDSRFLLIVDESFYVKNPNAIRSAALLALRQFAVRCMVLCGTPAPNKPHDLVGQFNIADNGLTFRGIPLPDDRKEALPIVREAIKKRGIFLRRLKAEALPDLPTKTFQRVYLPLTGKQAELYQQCASDLLRRVEALSDKEFDRNRTTIFSSRTRLLQICSNPSGVDESYSENPAKIIALDSILRELIEDRDEKVVLWCYFTASLEAIVHRFRKYNPVRYDGAVSDALVRKDAVSRFQNDPATKLFVGNLAAASAGLTLHASRFAIYESYSNQAAHYLQSLDRIHRRGQTRPVEYIFLLCDQTIEAAELDRLVAKEAMARELLGDQYVEPLHRRDLIRELKENGAGTFLNSQSSK